jgi:hypothetical protein
MAIRVAGICALPACGAAPHRSALVERWKQDRTRCMAMTNLKSLIDRSARSDIGVEPRE